MQYLVGAQKDKRVLVLFLLGSFALCTWLIAALLPVQPTLPNQYVYNGQELVVIKQQGINDASEEFSAHNALVNSQELTPALSVVFNKRFPLNRASKKELQLLPGVGPGLAGNIYNYRLQHGHFSSIEQLMMVPGIGTKTAQTIWPLLDLSL